MGERGRGTLAKEKPPICGMLQRVGAVVIRMLVNVKQVTIGALIERTIAKGTLVYTDEYDICSRLVELGYEHETVCHAKVAHRPLAGTTPKFIMSLGSYPSGSLSVGWVIHPPYEIKLSSIDRSRAHFDGRTFVCRTCVDR